jgi:choline dehydrogenase-like flavoprotein
MDLVIGSGPAGVSVATALLARGRRVLMLDGGAVLDAAAEERRARMAGTDPADWPAGAQAAWQQPQFQTPPGQVRRYGSDFAMVPGGETLADPAPIALRASRAEGGLSNLWGAAVLPYRGADIAGWPISAEDLAPHYRAIAGFMPISGAPDDLEPLLPAFAMTGRTPLDPSPQGGELLRRFARRKSQLSGLGVHTGPARLAVDPACRQCGQCLHGCPWGYIYSARHTLAQLRARPEFEHRRATVRRIAEDGDNASVTLDSGEVLRAGRVFVAAGVLETARLLLASRPGPGTLTLKDSQHFFLPSLHRWRAPRRPDRLPYHTLPQAFAEIADPAISPHLVHAQIYTWNEFYAHDLIASYGARLPGSAPLWRALARRLIVSQVFLHSDHSARIGLRLAPDGRLTPTVHGNPDTPRVMAAAKARMANALRLAGLLALSPAARPGAPGSSFHVGGSIPMAAAPGPGESDVLGRPEGLERVHIVDPSVLPDIPATTITFSVMANAHRIGTLAP